MKEFRRFKSFVWIGAFGLAVSSQASELVASDIVGNLYTWNRTTSTFDLKWAGSQTWIGDIAWDPTSGKLFASQSELPDHLYSVDYTTGAWSVVGPLVDNGGIRAPMNGLDWNVSTGTLYGYTRGANGLHYINKTNGQTTRTSIFGPIVHDYTYDPINQRTIGLGAGILYEVNFFTGTHIQLATVSNFEGGIQFDDQTSKIMLVSRDGQVSWLDPANGYSQALIYNSGKDLTGMTSVPEPSSLLVTLGGLMWGLNRQRRNRKEA